MKSISASRFKEQCLTLLDRLGPEGLVITKRGKPVAKLTPIQRNEADLIGCLADKLTIKGDLLSTRVRWVAEVPLA